MGQYNDQRVVEKVQYPDSGIGIIYEVPTQKIAHAWGGSRWAVSQKGKMIHF